MYRSAFLTHSLRSLLRRKGTTVIVLITLTLGVVLLAGWLSARRAAVIQPVEALRYE